MKPEVKWAIGGIVVGIVVVIIISFFIVRSDMRRQKWLDTHCTIFGEMSDSVGVGTVYTGKGVGVGTTYIAGKTGYKCDDGKQYWE